MKEKTAKKGGKNLNFLWIVGLVLAILIILFALQNGENTYIQFFKAEFGVPLALLIFVCLGLGSILTLLFSIPGIMKRRKTKSKLQQEIKTLRKNYEELAAINSATTTDTKSE